MTTQLPSMVRGLCMASVPPGGLVPFTAFFLALGSGILLRSVYDLARPMRVGDVRETSRHILQWCVILGLTVAFGLGLTRYAGTWPLPAADAFGPWLRVSIGVSGGALALRSFLRMLFTYFRPQTPVSSIIPEFDSRLPAYETDPLPPMIDLEPAVADRPTLWRSNVPGFLIGWMLLAIAIVGWKMDSMCLLRLPR